SARHLHRSARGAPGAGKPLDQPCAGGVQPSHGGDVDDDMVGSRTRLQSPHLGVDEMHRTCVPDAGERPDAGSAILAHGNGRPAACGRLAHRACFACIFGQHRVSLNGSDDSCHFAAAEGSRVERSSFMKRDLFVEAERFPLAAAFTISRGSKTEAAVVTCTITEADKAGRGECVPYGRYGETIESVIAEIEAAREAIMAGMSREELQTTMKAGAARNAVDCALWDLEAKSGL